MNPSAPPLPIAPHRTIGGTVQATGVACLVALFSGSTALTIGRAMGGDLVDGWLLATRYTARLSFAFFLAAYVAPSLHRLVRSRVADALRRNRCAAAYAFATTHTVHLAAIVTYFVVAAKRPEAAALVVGGGAYATLYLMVATAGAARRSAGRRWRRLHLVGPHYVWFVFFVSYLGRAASGDPFWLPFVALTLGALAVRVTAYRRMA